MLYDRVRHIDVRCHLIRQAVEEGLVKLKYIKTEDNVADIFTKALPTKRFVKLKKMLFEERGELEFHQK